jgi:hypothetical protein
MPDFNQPTRLAGVDTTIGPHNRSTPSYSPETMSPLLQAIELLAVVKPTALTDDTTAAEIVKSALHDASVPEHIFVAPSGNAREVSDHIKIRSSHSLDEMHDCCEKTQTLQ